MFKKNKYEYNCIIPEIFNNKNTEFLDDSLYKEDLFKRTYELNDLFVKFISSLKEQEKSLYKYFKTQRFNLNQKILSDIEEKLTELDLSYAEFGNFSNEVINEFLSHLKDRYS
ncbi:hypothetical protein HDR59_05370 [bacterium]|nr:hypothetical protein [bacterium]